MECNFVTQAPSFIAYYRVSTAKQGRSGLGLDAQQTDVAACVSRLGGQLIRSYTDIESGKRDDRPELAKALRHCQQANARLIVAKLDRLSRDVAFIAQLQKSGMVSFIAADMPEAGEFQTQLMAVIAQHERKAISQRTVAALAAAKARGQRLGKPENLRNQDKGRANGNLVKSANATARASQTMIFIHEAQSQGVSTLAGLASYLNQQGLRTPRGGSWSAVQVKRVIARCP